MAPMNKQEVYDLLIGRGLWHEITEHPAVYNMEEMGQILLPYPEADAKNLFVRDDKKRNYYLITVKGDKRVDLKEFKRRQGTRSLTFASEGEMLEFLGLTAGSVTPLGLLNDQERRVKLYLDAYFMEAPAIIGVHPNDNTATVAMKTEDLIALLTEHGSQVEVVEI